jgi:hypothetical protein
MDAGRHGGSRFTLALAVALVGSIVVLFATLTYAVAHVQVFA